MFRSDQIACAHSGCSSLLEGGLQKPLTSCGWFALAWESQSHLNRVAVLVSIGMELTTIVGRLPHREKQLA